MQFRSEIHLKDAKHPRCQWDLLEKTGRDGILLMYPIPDSEQGFCGRNKRVCFFEFKERNCKLMCDARRACDCRRLCDNYLSKLALFAFALHDNAPYQV